jgi:PIN domain nuclease of toxin-antitoxin system
MKLLLDTHVVLWSLGSPSKLGKRCRGLVESGEHEVVVSAVSIAEMAVKESLGKLKVPDGVVELMWTTGFSELVLTASHAERLRHLPWHHKDPFDRMLVAQAQVDGLSLVTADRQCMRYGVKTIDARK